MKQLFHRMVAYHRGLLDELKVYLRGRPEIWQKHEGNGWKYFFAWVKRQLYLRSTTATPFQLGEASFWFALVMCFVNFRKVVGYIAGYIPHGAWWFIIPLWIVALEILWSKRYRDWHWRHEAYYFALYRYGPDSPNSMLVTMAIRIVKGGLAMGFIYVVMYGVDMRLGDIFRETLWKLWPLGVITAALYVFQGVYGYLTFGNWWNWEKTTVLGGLIAMLVTLYAIQVKNLFPGIAFPAISLPDFSLVDLQWGKPQMPDLRTSIITLVILLVGFGGGYLLFLLIKKIFTWVRENIGIEDVNMTAINVWWMTPSLFFILLWGIVGYRYYTEVYLPDRLAAQTAIEAVATHIPPSIPTTVTVLPSLTTQPTFTSTPDATRTPTFTPTVTFVPLPTDTALPTVTITATLPSAPVPGATQIMTLPGITPMTLVENCAKSTSSANYQVNFEAESAYCADGSARFNLSGGGFYYITLTVDASDPYAAVARFSLDGNLPADIACTLNGQPFDARNGFVQLPFSNFNSRLECPGLGLTAVAWSTK